MEVFFYGLFMDKDLLIRNGVNPLNPRKGYLNNYALKIGNRASLIQSKTEKAYGVIMTLTEEEIAKLYSEKSVSDYVPEKVTIISETNEHITAICYNLPLELLKGKNESYAKSLHRLAEKLNFPKEYLKIIGKNYA
ncbi:gamma-glutamylcyclotransferase family protein [Flagellimonas meishanensis]|uniref:gamma-glutamylcyclotransferase family protein n=1 Tax=Flagellimonas meishanensis TaxID=2873264 RepID=UPI001CA61C38|nr:gamma-glutamylcyclotransferase family protein [[Muricauda] meishanensis]